MLENDVYPFTLSSMVGFLKFTYIFFGDTELKGLLQYISTSHGSVCKQ